MGFLRFVNLDLGISGRGHIDANEDIDMAQETLNSTLWQTNVTMENHHF